MLSSEARQQNYSQHVFAFHIMIFWSAFVRSVRSQFYLASSLVESIRAIASVRQGGKGVNAPLNFGTEVQYFDNFFFLYCHSK